MSLPSGTFQESYAQDMAIFRTRTQWIFLFLFLIALFLAPFYVGDTNLTLLIVIGITVIGLYGLNILTGRCGLISMGHSGFMMVGGYASGILCAKAGLPFLAALPLAGLIAGLVGIIFGLPSLKIKGFYLIMATVAAYFIIHWAVLQLQDLTGGTNGLPIPRFTIFDINMNTKTNYYYFVLVILIIATYAAINIVRTRAGRAFVAIRDNDLAAEVMGVNLWSYKLQAFFIGCVFAGISGALSVQYLRFANLDQFPFMDSVWFLGMLIVGGMGSTTGVIFGVIALKLLDQLAIKIGPILVTTFHFGPTAGSALSLVLSGLIIILFLIFEPHGIEHLWGRIKNWYRLWPFSS
jgi:branched-chain amino acid transport system permease protein